MPNYNYGRYIAESLAGVLSQTHRNLELIVVDDCSRDNSVEILRDWEKRDPRIILLMNEVNRGAAGSQNHALSRMSGDFLCLCDADDVWYPHKLQKQLETFESNPSVGLVHSQADIIDSTGARTGQKFTEIYRPTADRNTRSAFGVILNGSYLCSSSTMLRRKCVEFAGQFHTELKYLYDWTYWMRVARKYEFGYVPEALLGYRMHGASTALDSTGYAASRLKAGELILGMFPDLEPRYRSQLLYRMGVSQLELGRPGEAHRSFAEAVKANAWRWKAWARWVQTLKASHADTRIA